MSRFQETPRIKSMNNEHMSVVLLVDTSGSVSGIQMLNINQNLNRFKDIVCQSPLAAKCVDVCVMAFDDDVRVIQDWCPIEDMKSMRLSPGGMTDLNGAVLEGVRLIRERSQVYAQSGIMEKKPYLIVMTDGEDTVTGNVASAAAAVSQRVTNGKLKFFFLGFGDYDKASAAALTASSGAWCFEVESGDCNFNDFFDFVANSAKAASVSAPGERVHVETPIGTDASNVRTVSLDGWLND